MENKRNIRLISSLFLLSSMTLPIVLTSCKNSLNYTDGIINNGNMNSTNDDRFIKGDLSNDLKELENNSVKINSINVSSNITFKDYEKGSKDNSGKNLFIHERGKLLENKLQLSLKQNKDDFIKNFNFNSYLNSIPQEQKNILNPSNEKFLKDLKLFIIWLFHENNDSLSIELKNNDQNSIVNFNKNDNTITFNITFILKNNSSLSKIFKFENINKEIYPNSETEFSLSVVNAKISNVINFVSNRYLLGWEIKKVNYNIGSDSGILESFIPNKNTPSYSYSVEFFNLVRETSDYNKSDNGAKEFMNSLTNSFIKEQLNKNIINNQKMIFEIFPDVADIFYSLEKNLTLGETLEEFANPLASMLKKFNVSSKFIINFATDLLKSFSTGEGLLKIFVDHKKDFIDFISTSFGSNFGDLNTIINMIFDPISMDMSEEAKNEILSFLNSLTFPGIEQVKIITSKAFNNEPTIDLLDYVLTHLEKEIKSFLNSIRINDDTYKLIFEIINKLIDREKKSDGSTIVNGKYIFYKNTILDIFFEDTSTKGWLYDSIAKILKSYGTDIKGMQMGLIDEVINQLYLNNSKISVNGIQTILRELRYAFSFLGNNNNYEIVTETKKEVIYDNKNKKFDFEIVSKVVLKKDYTFSLEKIFNLLPNIIQLSYYKLGNDASSVINQWKWLLNILGFNTTYLIAKTSLLTRMLPKRISFREKDSFVVKYTPIDGKLYYKQQNKLGNYYHGFTAMLNAHYYIEQRNLNDGVISNLYKEFNSGDDYNQIAENLVQYEYQAEQNYKMFDEYTQKLLTNRINTTIWFNGLDESKKITSPLDETIYTNGRVFRWYDTDFTNELFKVGSGNFLSRAFNNIVSKVKYRDVKDLASIKSYRITNSNNNNEQITRERKEAYFEKNDEKQINDTLYYLGSGINLNDITQATKPLFHIKTEKDIGIGLNFLGFSINVKKIYLKMEFLAFETSILFPYNVLDATNYSKDKNGTIRLNNLKFSNKFSKTFIIPRFSIVL